jgi:hypothetical protein
VCVCQSHMEHDSPSSPSAGLSPNDWHALMFLQMRFLPPPFKALYSVIRVLCCVFFCRRRASYIRRGGGRFIPNIRTRKSMRERESIHQAGRKWQTVRRQSMWEGPCYRSGKCVCVQVVQSAAVHPPCIYPTPTTAVLLEHTKERPAQLKAVDQRIRVTLHVETTPYVTYQMLVSVW